GCSDSDKESVDDTPNTYVEGEVATDSSIRTKSNDVVVMQLEHFSSNVGAEDSSGPGIDCVTYNLDKALTTILSTKEYTPIYSVTLMNNETGDIIASSNPKEDSKSVTLESSVDYSLCLTHDNTYEDQTFLYTLKS
ncbi:MAG: hypothetical protein U9P72_07960, partial [Campylobacterota bacterium]|nr:hypothetical protein [Campylobacterota bacterium]